MKGPPSVLEGRYGVLEAFCEETDASLLTKGLGETWEIERLAIKRYRLPRDLACAGAVAARLHRAARFLRRRHRRDRGRRVRQGRVAPQRAEPRRHHAGAVQRCRSTWRSPPITIHAIRMCTTTAPPPSRGCATSRGACACAARAAARAGRRRSSCRCATAGASTGAADTFLGCPQTPLSDEQLRFKFDRLCKDGSPRLKQSLFDDLMRVEALPSLASLRLD